MSISPKDLQNIFDELLNGGPSSVMAAAAHIGGRVIAGTPAVTRNARDMTALLGGGTQRYAGTASGSAKSFAEQLGKPSGTGQEPTGSRGKPFSVEFTAAAVRNLAAEIGKASAAGGKPPSTWEKFLHSYNKGAEASRAYRPSAIAGDWISGKLKKFFGMDAEKDEGAGGRPAWMKHGPIDLINQRLSEESAAQLKRGGMSFRSGDPNAARRARAVQYGEVFSGVPSEKGYSNQIKSPPAAGAAAGEAAEGLAGIAGTAAELIPVIGEIVAVGAIVIPAFVKMGEAAHQFAKETEEGNRHLGKWNGALAVANARMQIGDIKREAEMGRVTGGSAATLQEHQNYLKDEWQPISEALQNVKNLMATVVTDVEIGITWLVKFGSLIGPIATAINFFMGSKDSKLPMQDLFEFFQNDARLNNARAHSNAAAHGARAVKPGGAGGAGGMGAAAARPAAAAAMPRIANNVPLGGGAAAGAAHLPGLPVGAIGGTPDNPTWPDGITADQVFHERPEPAE